MNEITDWEVTPQHVVDTLEMVQEAKKMKEEQVFFESTPTNRISTKEWAERFMQMQPIDCTSWSNLTDIGDHFEQSSTTQKQSESTEVVGTSLQRRAGSFGFQKLGEYLESDCGSYETTGLLEELQELTQKVSNEESCALRADELLQANTRKVRHSSSLKEAFKRKNYGNNYSFKKSGHY